MKWVLIVTASSNRGPGNLSTLIDTKHTNTVGRSFCGQRERELRCMLSRGGQANGSKMTISKQSPAIEASKMVANREYSTNFLNQVANTAWCNARTVRQARAAECKTAFATSSCHSKQPATISETCS